MASLTDSLLVADSAAAQRSVQERRIEEPSSELQARSLAEPDVAYAGGQFLVVWTEQRITDSVRPLNQVLAARVTPTGEVLDPRGIIVARSGTLRREPRVVASDGAFIVFWREA